MAATTKEIITAGPAASPAAAAVRTKSPAPIMAPIPRAIRLAGPRVLFSPLSPSPAEANSCSNGFFINKLMKITFRVRLDFFQALKVRRLLNLANQKVKPDVFQ